MTRPSSSYWSLHHRHWQRKLLKNYVNVTHLYSAVQQKWFAPCGNSNCPPRSGQGSPACPCARTCRACWTRRTTSTPPSAPDRSPQRRKSPPPPWHRWPPSEPAGKTRLIRKSQRCARAAEVEDAGAGSNALDVVAVVVGKAKAGEEAVARVANVKGGVTLTVHRRSAVPSTTDGGVGRGFAPKRKPAHGGTLVPEC